MTRNFFPKSMTAAGLAAVLAAGAFSATPAKADAVADF